MNNCVPAVRLSAYQIIQNTYLAKCGQHIKLYKTHTWRIIQNTYLAKCGQHIKLYKTHTWRSVDSISNYTKHIPGEVWTAYQIIQNTYLVKCGQHIKLYKTYTWQSVDSISNYTKHIPGEVWTAKEDPFHANLLRWWPGLTAAHTSAAHYTADRKDLPAVSLPVLCIAHIDSVIH